MGHPVRQRLAEKAPRVVAPRVRLLVPSAKRWAKLCRAPTNKSERTNRAYGACVDRDTSD
jgi:hypothetical protein